MSIYIRVCVTWQKVGVKRIFQSAIDRKLFLYSHAFVRKLMGKLADVSECEQWLEKNVGN